MASSALNIFSGIAAAAAGLAGDKVSKSGAIPGLDIASILPALLGKSGGLMGTLASVASKSGLINSSNIGKLAELAGSLLTSSAKTTGTAKASAGGVAGLAAAIIGNSGAANLGSIATMASKLAKTAETPKQLNGLASELGKTLSSSFGVSLGGAGSALKGLDSVLEKGDTKADLFKSILKGLA